MWKRAPSARAVARESDATAALPTSPSVSGTSASLAAWARFFPEAA